MKKIKVLFILDFPGRGGAQKVILNIFKYINREKFNPKLAVFNWKGEYIKNLANDFQFYNLNIKRTRFIIIPLFRLIKEIKPDLIFSTLLKIDGTTNIALKLSGNSSKIILRSSNFLSRKLPEEPVFTRILSREAYKCADRIVSLTEEMKKDMHINLNLPLDKIKVIPNPIDIEMIKEMSIEPVKNSLFHKSPLKNYHLITSMGRLTKQKGFSYLLRAFKTVRSELPVKLVMLGRGDEKKELETLAKNLNIDKDITFLGFQSNPYKYIANADLFVLSSLWEGFPNALVEAMACGTPVISTDCPSGPKEIITSGVNGILVPTHDPESLANAIFKVLTDKELSIKLTIAGKDRVNDFEVKRIVGKYEELFKTVIGV